MKKFAITVGAVALALGLAGCTGTGMLPKTSDDYMQVYVVQMPDDTSVDCVASYSMRSISCDWERRS